MEIPTKEPVVEAPAPVVAAPVVEPVAPAPKKEETIGEALGTAEVPATETVPLATFLEVKSDNKKLAKDIKDLQDKVAAGAPKAEISDDIAAIGKKYDVNSDFLAELTGAISTRAQKEADARIEEATRPQKERDRAEKLDKVFRTHFDAAIENAPEFKEIANPEVIKTLSLDPKNKDKTFAEIIEETYGSAIQGKRTIETTVPGGGKEPTEIDYEKAAKDTEYFAQIMANPTLKKQYNSDLGKRLKL